MAVIRSNVIIPEIFTPYVEQLTTLRSQFLQSGIITPVDALNATEGGDTINVPNFAADLAGDAEVLSDTTSLTPAGITATKQVGVVLHRGKMWTVREMAKLAAGADPMAAIAGKTAAWINNQMEKDLIATLDGCFGPLTSNTTGCLKGMTVDSTSGTPAPFGPRQVAQAKALLGDQGDRLTAVAMNSACFYDLVERKMIDYVLASDSTAFNAGSGATDAVGGSFAPGFQAGSTQVPVYGDLRVIVTDNIAVSSSNYGCYFFAAGSVGTGSQQGLVTETDRDIAALEDAMTVHWHNVIHPLGVAYATSTAGVNPTRTVLGTATSWTKIFETKNIGIVRATITSNFD